MIAAISPFSDIQSSHENTRRGGAGAENRNPLSFMSGNGEQGNGGAIYSGGGGAKEAREMVTGQEQARKRRVCKVVDSPVGKLTLVATDRGLAAILWENDRPGRVRLEIDAEDSRHPVLVETERQLNEYFEGTRKTFALTLDVEGTDFQRQVWEALLTIPFGETRSYGQIAKQIGRPRAVRAVGAANGRNPVSIVAPCHRVIGSTGKLTGFAGGIRAKATLLSLEGRVGLEGA
jgi:methylated-DNA-[protein]-cysteine S-methyltransferase